MVEGVEPLAHHSSLLHLHLDLFLSQGSQQHEQRDGVEDGPVSPHLRDAGSNCICEVVLLDVEKVGSSGTCSEECGALEDSL